MKRAAAALAALLLAFGCRTPTPAEVGVPLAPDDPRPPALLEEWRVHASSIDGMRGSARFSLDSPDLQFRRPQRVAAERPGKLRVEIMGLFGQIAGVLVTRDDRYQFFDASTHEIEAGIVTRDLLWELARIDLTQDEVVDLLLGGPTPRWEWTPGASVALSDGGVRIELMNEGDPVGRVEFDPDGRPRRIDYRARDGAPPFEVELGRYRPSVGADVRSVAHEMRLRFPHQDTEASFEFGSIELNPTLPPSLFVLPSTNGTGG